MNPDQQKQAETARDELARFLERDSNVSLIDIGFDPTSSQPLTERPIVLRVHLRKAVTASKVPAELHGFPVRTMIGDYKLR